MSVYTVPQDVEADDRILGPFTFRQFIYLIVVALALGLAYLLGRLFIGLAIIPIPIALFFGALALPLRRDQPMETYLAAIAIYFLKPRKRYWSPDGLETLIEITVPKTPNSVAIKDASQDEVRRKLSYLADIVDSDAKLGQNNVLTPTLNTVVYQEEIVNKPVAENDPLEDSETAVRFDQKLEAHKTEQKELMSKIVTGEIEVPAITEEPLPKEVEALTITEEPLPKEVEAPVSEASKEETVPLEKLTTFNPYPATMQQTVIQPLDEKDQLPEKKEASQKPASADIIRLATNDDLSVAAIAREANRIREKQSLEEEVIISLR